MGVVSVFLFRVYCTAWKHILLASIKIKSLLWNDILPRYQACIESDGGTFEYKLKSFKRRLSR